jgi:hypothetical protein
MSLLLKVLADSARTHDGVVAAARREFEQELAAVATEPFSLKLYALRKSEWGNLALGTGAVAIDRALYGVVPTALGLLHVALPFSAKDTLGGQFLLEIAQGTPLHLRLERGALGGWTSSWQVRGAARALREHPLGKALTEARVGSGLEWNSHLAGGYTVKHQWTMALTPRGANGTRLVAQTGTTRLLLVRSFGVKAALTSLASARHVLASEPFSSLTPLDEVATSESMVEHLAELVASGLAPVETTPRVASPKGPLVLTADEKERREVSHRALLSFVLSVCSLPLFFCLPLSAFTAWLGWSARRRATRAKLPVPFFANAGLALAAFSMLLCAIMALSLPGQWKTEQEQRARRSAALRAVDAARARAQRPSAPATMPDEGDLDDPAERLKQLVERRASATRVGSPARSDPSARVVSSSSRKSPATPPTHRTVEP